MAAGTAVVLASAAQTSANNTPAQPLTTGSTLGVTVDVSSAGTGLTVWVEVQDQATGAWVPQPADTITSISGTTITDIAASSLPRSAIVSSGGTTGTFRALYRDFPASAWRVRWTISSGTFTFAVYASWK